MTNRITNKFKLLKAQNRTALVSYIMGCDPDYDTSLAILKGLPEAGADIIELGMAFSDPMADGKTIQLAGNRALKAGSNISRIFQMVAEFRAHNHDTPIILMGYYNPILHYGIKKFVDDAVKNGVDGVIIVDLPFEEEEEFTSESAHKGLDLIRLTAPTTTKKRAQKILKNASGFVYYVSVAGITGTKSADIDSVKQSVERLSSITDIPIAVGFGIKTPSQAKDMAQIADAVVVGSAFVDIIAQNIGDNDKIIEDLHNKVSDIAAVL